MTKPYDARWRRLRALFLRANPACVFCKERGRIELATVVDHKIPHRGDMDLFWDQTNWQSLCATCHNSPKKRMEMSGALPGCDEDGVPVDPGHHWSG